MAIDGPRQPGLVRESAAAIDPSAAVLLPAVDRWVSRARLELTRSLREHSLLIAFVAVYVAYGKLLPRWFGVATAGANDLYSGYFLVLTAVAAGGFAVCYAIRLKLVVKPADFVAALLDASGRFLTLRRLCMALPVMLILPLFGATFTNLKVLIPAIMPFGWDPAFAEWDRLLHGGYHPWQLLQPLLGYPYVTSLINAVYHLWFFLAYAVICWQIASTDRPRLRMQYLLTFVLVWAVIGNIAAMLLSSAGPVYFGRVTGLPDPYAPLMSYLHEASAVAPVPALHVQDMLWRLYESQGLAVGGGISAMPSLHVAIAFSFVLLARAIDRRLAIAFTVSAAFILVGSVHLGWHYAIDGYVGIVAAWLIWGGVGWLLDRRAVARLLWGESSAME
jgi:hypothetical protein